MLAPGSRVLDAGAGASKYRSLFAHCRYETQDFCQYEGKLVKYLTPIDYVCDITSIPVTDGSFDAILCTEVLEHVTDPMAVLAEFSRLIKPGGKVFLSTPLGTLLHMEPYHFYGGFTHLWYRHWLAKHGFSIDYLAPQGGAGRAAVSSLQAFYSTWKTWELSLPAPKRTLSLVFRMLLKLLAHYLFPRALPILDPFLEPFRSCNGLIVTATRK